MSADNATTETFERRGGVAGKHGLVFQNQMVALMLARALASDPEGARIGAEHAHVGSFDDVSVRMHGVDGREMLILLQLKHRSGVSPAVGSQALRADKGPFSVKKYYRSYVEDINVQKLNADPRNTYYVIFTNASLPESALVPASEDIPWEADCLLNMGCSVRSRPHLLSPEADYLAGEPRAEEFQPRFIWMGEQASEEEINELLKQAICAHLGFWAADATQRVDILLRAVEEWYEDTGYVSYLSATWGPWQALRQVDPPLLRGLCFSDIHIKRILKQLASTPRGGVLHLSCDVLNEELRGAKMASVASQRPLLVARLGSKADFEEVDIIINMWERGWCRELALLLPQSKPTVHLVNKEDLRKLQERLLKALASNEDPARPYGAEGRVLVLLAPATSDAAREHPLATWLRDNLCSRDLWIDFTDSFAYRHLSREVRESVLQSPVEFQGRSCRLADLNQEHVLDAWLWGDTLAALLRARSPLRIGCALAACDADRTEFGDLYIPRRFQKYISVHNTIFRAPNIDDIFVVKDVTKDELDALVPYGSKVQLLDRQDADTRFIACRKMSWSRFRDFCDQNPGRRCHLLKNVEGVLMWRQSGGEKTDPQRVAVVQEHLKAKGEERENNMAFVKGCVSCTPFEEELVNTDIRTVVISGDPGAGKSSVLSHAALLLSERHPGDWVIHLSLADHTDALAAAAEAIAEGDSSARAVALVTEELLLRAAGLSHGRDSRRGGSRDEEDLTADEMAARLLKDRLWETGRLRVLVDAFDEISPDFTEVVVTILKALQSSCISSLWVASRQLLEDVLEQELGVNAFGLKPLSVVDQERFWVHHWKHSLQSPEPREVLAERAQVLLKWLGGRFRHQFRLNIPLHTSILAEILGNSFLSGDFEDRLKRVDVLYIYEKFIEVKFDIYIRDKASINGNTVVMRKLLEALYKDFMEKHQICALMETDLFDHLPLKIQKEIYEKVQKFIQDVEKGVERTGIITCVINRKPKFIHRTFAEYFAGIWVAANHNSYSGMLDAIQGKRFKMVKTVTDHTISMQHPLHKAVLNSDLDEVKILMKKSSTDIDEVDNGGRTALSLSVQKNTPAGLSICKLLLENGAKVQFYRDLYFAAANQSWDIIKLLLNHSSTFQNSSLLKNIFEEVLKEAFSKNIISEEDLVLQNFNINVNWNIFSGGRSILHICVQCGRVSCVESLLQMGANASNTDNQLNTPLHYAVQCMDESIIDLLITANLVVHPRNIRGETPLYLACSKGNKLIAQKLLSYSSSTNFRSKSGSTLLHASVDHPAVIDVLLSHDCKINATDSRGNTVLHEAVRKRKHYLVDFLVKKGANINCTNFQNFTPLFIAVTTESSEDVRTLLIAGADVSIGNSRGDTPLHIAIMKKNFDIISLLLNNGADPNIENLREESSVEVAKKYGLLELLNNLCSDSDTKTKKIEGILNRDKIGKSVEQNFIKSVNTVDRSEEEQVKRVIKVQVYSSPLTLNPSNDSPSSPSLKLGNSNSHLLLAAVRRKDTKAVKQIVSTLSKDPADWLATSTNGDTALHIAARTCPVEIVSILCSRAPLEAVSARNEAGATPAHIAATRKDHNASLALLGAGADMAAVDGVGDSPMHVACRLAVYKQVRYLCPRLSEQVLTRRNARGDTLLHLALALGKSKEEVALDGANHGTLLIRYENKDVTSRWQASNQSEPLCSPTQRPCSRAQLVRTLLESMPSSVLSCANAEGDTPLHVATRGRIIETRGCVGCSTWCPDILQLLLDRGADVAVANSMGDTVLHEAFRNPGDISAIKVLLQARGAHIALSMKNNIGNTPLHDAARYCHEVDLVRMVVEKGGDPRIINSNGELPHDVANRVGNTEVLYFLKDIMRHRNDTQIFNKPISGQDFFKGKPKYFCPNLSSNSGNIEPMCVVARKDPLTGKRDSTKGLRDNV